MMPNNMKSSKHISLLWCVLIASQFCLVQSFSFLCFSKSYYNTRFADTTTLKAHGNTDNINSFNINRQAALKKLATTTIPILLRPQITHAKVSIKPDAAFQSLLSARQELTTASNQYLLSKDKDYEGLKDYLSDPALNINNYEENANALLASKQLDAESKKEIGTIRRYGVGADVIIMYGGVKAELEEEEVNFTAVSKALQRTMDSLDEVIAICKSNGF